MWFELKLLLKMLCNLIWNDENVCEKVALYWTPNLVIENERCFGLSMNTKLCTYNSDEITKQ